MTYAPVHDVPASREGCGALARALERALAGPLVHAAVRAAHQVLGHPLDQGGREVAND